MKKISLLLVCLCALLHASAQYYTNQNKVWVFGDSVGFNFNSGVPTPFKTNFSTLEGSASVSNTAGQLLFYTDGRTVYNKIGTVMPGGDSIVSFTVNSAVQPAVIVPFINDTSKYYIFSVENAYDSLGRFAFSIVDMTMDGGMGGIVPGTAGIILDSGMSEKMISVAGNNCDIWLITHKKSAPQFLAYNITSSGVNTTPIISNIGSLANLNAYASGVMKCSHNRKKIVTVSCNWANPTPSNTAIELYDFNATTGNISNCQTISSYISAAGEGGAYGAEFSPDNTKLYATPSWGSIQQWDISLPTTAAITASKLTLLNYPDYASGDLKLGPDNKIYNCIGYFVNCINFPNLPGSSCGLAYHVINIGPKVAQYGLPNTVWNAQSTLGMSILLVGATTTLTAPSPGGLWSSSDTTKAKVNSSGVVTAMGLGTTTIYYTLPSGCKMSAVINIVKNNSVGTIEAHVTPTLYPNPASNEVTIKTEQSTFTSFVIYNAVGQLVSIHKITEPEMKVDVKAFPPGEYRVIFTGDGVREMQRFVKW